MVKIRLKRVGSKKAPHYRVVAVDVRSRRDGKPLEELGYYNPRSKDLKLDQEAVARWMKNGAQPSDTVASLLRKAAAAGAGAQAGYGVGRPSGPPSSSTAAEDLAEYILRVLARDPDALQFDRKMMGSRRCRLGVTREPTITGRLIGKDGKTITALRNLSQSGCQQTRQTRRHRNSISSLHEPNFRTRKAI